MSNTNKTAPWPQRFGTIEKLQVKTGRKGRYAVVTVNCKTFTQTAFAFTDKLVDQMIAAGEGASVWMKGPIEQVERKNDNGGTYKVDQMKLVYFKNKSAAAEAPEAAEEAAPAPAEPQDLTAVKGIGAAVAEALNAAGIINYAQLADASDEALDEVKAGLAKRAASGDYRGQAKALAEAAENARVAEEIPF